MASYYDQINNSGPKVWYRFNETSGTPANSGSLSTTSYFSNITLNQPSGVDGVAISLNGTSSNIQLPAHATFSLFNDKSFTVEAWVKIANADTNRTSPLEIFRLNAPSSPHYAVALVVDGTAGTRGKVRLASSWTTDILSTNTIDDNQWHHIVYTYNTSSVKLYIDGTLNSSTTPSSLPASFNFDESTKKLIGAGYVGTSQTSISQYFKGYIDEFAAYDYELTSTNISQNFIAGAYAEYAATSQTATALAVQPSLTTETIYTASPATASATADGHYQTDLDLPILLEQYMQSLATAGYLEQWYKFDQFKVIGNYGNGGNSGIGFFGNATNAIQGGVQGSGCIGYTGSINDGFIGASNPLGTPAFNPEISDGNYVLGMWTYIPSSITSSRAIFNIADSSGRYVGLTYSGSGIQSINAQVNTSSGVHQVTGSAVVTNGWHFIALKFSGTTMQLFIDGTSQGTATVNGTLPGTITTGGFGNNNVSAFGGDKMLVSQFFIGNTTNITNTVLTNIYNAGKDQVQGTALMAMPAFKDDNAFNSYVLGLNPYFYYKLDETSGAPQSVAEPMPLLVEGSNYTQNITTKNKKGIRFTNRDTVFGNLWTAPAGTFSTNNKQSFAVYAKPIAGSNANLFASTGAANSSGSGIGLSLIISSSQQTSVRIFTSFAASELLTNTTVNVTDGNYHLFVAVKDGNTLKLYIDGKLTNSQSSASTLTDNGQFLLGGHGASALSNLARDITIDEVAMFADALTDAQIFEMYRSLTETMDTTAQASLPMPAVQAGFGPTVAVNVMTASASLPNVFPFVSPATADGLFQMPNFAATKNTSQTAEPMTASAQGENPGWDIGENNQVIHMDASAQMGDARALIPGRWNANPFIALNAQLVQPNVVTTLGALIKPQSLNVNAFMVIPPAYYLPSDDRWYQVMLDVNTGITDSIPTIKFFNSPNTIYVGGEWNNLQATTALNGSTTPLPAAYTGFFDPTSRAALNIRNIALQLSQSTSSSDSWTMETYIQTSKANQYLFTTRKDNSAPSPNTGSGISLKNGKITFIASNTTNLETGYETFGGFKNIADGQWHHIIIQYFGATVEAQNRVQVWIDGKLDIQRYGYTPYIPGRIGYNSSNINLYSDFNISGFAINSPSIINERDTSLHYFAAIGHEPYLATPATATTTFGTGTRGKGNRARALMLYFWPTFKADEGYYVGEYTNPFAPVGVNDTNGKDVGNEEYDYDTFYGLSTYLTESTQQFFDWDVFPLPVQRFYAGDTYRGDRNPLLKDTVKIGQGPYGDTYKDEVTDNYRYLNLIKDVYELDQYDAIFFRNYPDQSKEQDEQGLNSKTEVDEYFNLQEKELFKEFLDSLREAVDEYGISLFVTNPQLAVDLGIIEAATPVPLLRNTGKFNAGEYSDNRAPVVTGRVDNVGIPTDPVNEYGAGWDDTFFNDRHRVINTLEYLTDDNAFIWTDYAFYNNADEFNYGGPDRLYRSYENRPYGLQVGDEFVFADSGNPRFRLPFQAIKPEHLKAGIPITALGTTIHEQNLDSYATGINPYKDYITTVALPPGTNLNGKLTKGKIFVSFSENVANSFTAEGAQFGTSYEEYHQYDLATNYWVDIAFNAGLIDANTRALYKNSALTDAERGQPALKDDNDLIAQKWSLNGDYLVTQLVPITRSLKGFVGGEVGPEIPPQNRKRTRGGLGGVTPSTRLRDALGRFASGGSGGGASATTGGLVTYKVTTGRIYDTGFVFIPSINTRGLWWLSDKNVLEGKVVGGVGMSASATMPNPVVTADHPANISAPHMLAQAVLVDNTSGTKTILALPLTASALMPTLGGRTIVADPATASGVMVFIYPLTETDYTVTLYLNHTDPILYIRKEVIK